MHCKSASCQQVPVRILTALTISGALIAAVGPSFGKGKPGGGTTPPYVYTDLGGFRGESLVQSEAFAISNVDATGVVSIAGSSSVTTSLPHVEHSALWEVTTTGGVLSLQDTGTAGGLTSAYGSDEAFASAVNDAGWTTGSSTYGNYYGFASIPGVGVRLLPTFNGLSSVAGSSSDGRGINNFGVVVGQSTVDAQGVVKHGALWQVDSQGNVAAPIDLGGFFPWDINDFGVMAGHTATGPAIAWFDSGDLQIHPLPSATGGVAYAINNHNDVAGVGSTATAAGPFYCSATGTTTILPTLGGDSAKAWSINDQGQIVGWALYPKKGNQRKQVAVIWQNGVISDLNQQANAASSGNLFGASGINNAGQIVGTVELSTVPEIHGFLLTLKP